MQIPPSSQQPEFMSWRERSGYEQRVGKQKEVNFHLVDNGLFKKRLQGIYLSSCGQGFQSKNTSVMVLQRAEQF